MGSGGCAFPMCLPSTSNISTHQSHTDASNTTFDQGRRADVVCHVVSRLFLSLLSNHSCCWFPDEEENDFSLQVPGQRSGTPGVWLHLQPTNCSAATRALTCCSLLLPPSAAPAAARNGGSAPQQPHAVPAGALSRLAAGRGAGRCLDRAEQQHHNLACQPRC